MPLTTTIAYHPPPKRPEGKPRIILEKSSTIQRRHQRSNKVFRFTEEELARIERQEERDQRAKELREREKRRIANKKKKTEQDIKARELARRQGSPKPEPNPWQAPSSQPRLSAFFGIMKQPDQESPHTRATQESKRMDQGEARKSRDGRVENVEDKVVGVDVSSDDEFDLDQEMVSAMLALD